MSINLSAGSLKRTTNLPAYTAVSWCGWCFSLGFGGGDYTLMSLDDGATSLVGIGSGVGGITLFTAITGAGVTIVANATALNTWTWIGFIAGALTTSAYWSQDGINFTTAGPLVSAGAGSPNGYYLSNDGFATGPYNGLIWGAKLFGSALTVAQLQNEAFKNRPFITPNTWNPLVDLANPGEDYSGQGGGLTLTGSVSVSAQNPPVPWKG